MNPMHNPAQHERKIISVSQKRQITIPQKYFESLGFNNEAECILQDGGLFIRPVKDLNGGAFAEQILADLIAQGLQGNELLEKFREQSRKVRPAVVSLINEADALAQGQGKSATLDDLFGTED